MCHTPLIDIPTSVLFTPPIVTLCDKKISLLRCESLHFYITLLYKTSTLSLPFTTTRHLSPDLCVLTFQSLPCYNAQGEAYLMNLCNLCHAKSIKQELEQ